MSRYMAWVNVPDFSPVDDDPPTFNTRRNPARGHPDWHSGSDDACRESWEGP